MQIYEKLFKYTIFRKKKDIFYIFKSRFLMNHKSLKINIFIFIFIFKISRVKSSAFLFFTKFY